MVSVIVIVAIVCIGITYAFINQTLTGIKKQVITAGNLELELKEGNAITINNTLPMYDEVGLTQKPYISTLMNNSDGKVSYKLKLVDVTSSENKLDTVIVKYGLTKNG